jgi:hypothetical protein
LYLSVFLFPSMAYAQQQTPAPQATSQAPAPAGPKQPDYPDPRTLTIGVWYWLTIPGNGPNIVGGLGATGYETLDSLGADHRTPAIEVSYPITRTGVLHFEGFESKGDGTQYAPSDTTVFATAFNKNDFLATQYQIKAGKLYLEDLLYPFKFPVAKFRLRSLWEVQYIGISSTVSGHQHQQHHRKRHALHHLPHVRCGGGIRHRAAHSASGRRHRLRNTPQSRDLGRGRNRFLPASAMGNFGWREDTALQNLTAE